MSQHDHELWQLLDKIQMDVRDLSARIVELRSQISRLKLPDAVRHVCPEPLCRLEFRSQAKLAEHVYISHDGPVPDHYQRAEELANE